MTFVLTNEIFLSEAIEEQVVLMVLFLLVLDSAMDYKRGILIIGDLASWHDLGSFLQLKEQK